MRLSPAKQLALVLLVALALRLTAAWCWHERTGGQFVFGDSDGYWVLARAVARGEPYQYGPETQIFRTPGYPVLLAPIFLIAGPEASVFWGRAWSAVFGTLSVAGVWWLGKRLFGPAAAMAAAVVTAFYPGAIATSVLVLTEAPFGLLMLVHLILWTVAWQTQGPRRAAGLGFSAGLAAGVATLVRPSWLLFTPFALAIGLAYGRPRTRHLGIGLAMLAGLALAMTPWVIRNERICGHLVPTSLQVGASLYDGLNPESTGASDMRFVAAMDAAERADPGGGGRFARPTDTFEYRLDRRMRAEALDWARRHPARVAQLALVKLVRIWNIWPNEPSLSNWAIRLAVALSYMPVLALALVGAWRTIDRGWPYVLCWLPAVYFTLLHMVFVGSIRYRQPAMLALVVLAAGAVFAGAIGEAGERGRSSSDSVECAP
jgi:4-amino-4-deoxy-L-arabinose transferase-like glycosyltransferase